jgi:vitellogenic carboxypeptidase-like protein
VSLTQPETAPLLLWLQGGPGGSSLYGLFVEHGPFSVTSDLKLVKRPTAWTLSHNVIYIDNPVGTGFSFTSGGYAENETAVAEDLFDCIIQLYTLFPEFQASPQTFNILTYLKVRHHGAGNILFLNLLF